MFRAFKIAKANSEATEQLYFGLWDPDNASLVLARDDEVIAYGHAAATERLLRQVHRWVDLGMPTAASFGLHVYQSDRHIVTRENQWLVKRQESQFLWSL